MCRVWLCFDLDEREESADIAFAMLQRRDTHNHVLVALEVIERTDLRLFEFQALHDLMMPPLEKRHANKYYPQVPGMLKGLEVMSDGVPREIGHDVALRAAVNAGVLKRKPNGTKQSVSKRYARELYHITPRGVAYLEWLKGQPDG